LPNGLDAAWLSRDAAVVEAYRRDPLVSHRVSVRWFTAAGAALREAHERAPGLRVPALILVASADQLVDPQATLRLARTLPAGLAELVEWDGWYHELFNEPEKEKVFLRLEEWLERRRTGAQNTLNLK
jgi:lysophospholipase